MAGSEAKIRIGIDGANDVRNALRLIKSDFASLEKEGNKLAKGIGNGFLRLGVDVAKAANDMRALDFGSAADKFKGFDDTLARMSIRGGKNLEDLRSKVTALSTQTGVAAPRMAEALRVFDRSTFSGLDAAAVAVRDLSDAADDADSSLEEMLGLGADLYTKMGVPAQRVGDELRRIRDIAADVRLPAGALIPSLQGIMAGGGKRVEGGAQRVAAMAAALTEQGYSPQVAGEMVGNIVDRMNALPQHLVRRAIRSETKAGKDYEPYVRSARTGNVQLRDDAYEHIQAIFRRKGMGALVGMGDADALEAGLALRDLNYKRVKEIQTAPERLRKGGAIDLTDGVRGSALTHADALYREMLGKAPLVERSAFSETPQAERNRVEQEKAAVEMGVGAKVQRARDRRDAYYKGRRGTQAAIDTITSYMPGQVQDAIHLGEAASFTTPGLPGGRIDPQSEGLAAAARALHSAAEKLDKMPAATAAAIQKVDLKVREAPLGAAREAARTGY